jgi:hypothetical protein
MLEAIDLLLRVASIGEDDKPTRDSALALRALTHAIPFLTKTMKTGRGATV